MTSTEVEALRQRVQNRAELYCSRGMDPLKVETLLDEVHSALRYMEAILHACREKGTQ